MQGMYGQQHQHHHQQQLGGGLGQNASHFQGGNAMGGGHYGGGVGGPGLPGSSYQAPGGQQMHHHQGGGMMHQGNMGSNQPSEETAEPADRDQVSDEQRRRLHHDKAEAIARYLEGSRLAQLRDAALQGKKVDKFSRWQLEVLQKWDDGTLRKDRNDAVLALGHGRLENADGDYLDMGGSTGGGSRRIIDGWQPPCWRTFLKEDAWQ